MNVLRPGGVGQSKPGPESDRSNECLPATASPARELCHDFAGH